jgi:hypothetical protein
MTVKELFFFINILYLLCPATTAKAHAIEGPKGTKLGDSGRRLSW